MLAWGTDLSRALQCAAFLPQAWGHRPGFVVFTEEREGMREGFRPF